MFSSSSGKIDLPSMPATLARIIQVTNSPEAAAEELARVVMLDQSLSTKVLRLANSAYYGRRTKAETITDAVVTLGFTSVRNLAASASVVDALFPKQMFPGFNWRDMWIHSVICAVGAEVIHGRAVGGSGANETAFVAGLLHDVGKLILARALPHRFAQIVETCREYKYDMSQAEIGLLSTDHSRIGGDLAKQWEFPDSLCEAIEFHHDPEAAAEYESLARAVQAANLLAKRLGRSYIVGIGFDISLKDVAEAANITVQDATDAVEQVSARMRQCGDLLSWGDGMPDAENALAA